MTQFPYSQYVQAAQAYGAGRSVSTAAVQIGAADPTLVAAYAVLWLRPGAPLSVVKAAYRSLAAQYHPDAGGEPLAMRRLNEAYETISRTLAT
jgi:DnaJ-class molecular chaperone